jgi:uncharacterized protein (DUF1800 family)
MTPPTSALIAATRFGFIARPGELEAIGADPRGWVMRQAGAPPRPVGGDLPSSADMVARVFAAQRDKRAPEDRKEFNQQVREVYLAEIGARIGAAVDGPTPLAERLTQFWSNHFTVSAIRPVVHGCVGAFEREAIRPHVFGRFSDMLLAVESHPAMLLYLDNALSIGPDSFAGMRQGKGLNENLGREILELHTLGVDGGYTQTDVEALAAILTGWSVARLNDPAPGGFKFYDRAHQPGAKTLLGRRYAEAGREEGVEALRDLAQHPATARHVAQKLARHFIADQPPSDAVERIAQSFRDSGGNLARVTQAVVAEDAVWRTPFAKLRTPTDMLIAACRVAGFTPKPMMLVATLRLMDQQPFFAPQPSGWPDDAASWAAPETVLRRAQWCEAFANRLPDMPDPAALVEGSLGPALSAETRDAVGRAPSRRAGLALALASPEFQRR